MLLENFSTIKLLQQVRRTGWPVHVRAPNGQFNLFGPTASQGQYIGIGKANGISVDHRALILTVRPSVPIVKFTPLIPPKSWNGQPLDCDVTLRLHTLSNAIVSRAPNADAVAQFTLEAVRSTYYAGMWAKWRKRVSAQQYKTKSVREAFTERAQQCEDHEHGKIIQLLIDIVTPLAIQDYRTH